jgi:hypothetical protein
MQQISNQDRRTKNKELIDRGNHKSALKYSDELQTTLEKEVEQGWMFPLPLTYISDLDHGELAPVGMDDKQWSDLPNGSKKVKLRLTHDQSFNTATGKSVNDRVLTDELEPLYYGGCLSRLIHYILSLRLRHPKVHILAGKSDIKAAYRRVSLHGDTAPKCAIMHRGFALVSTRLTFGGSPCPNEFCIVSETVTDLANDILHCQEWDPNEISSPHARNLRTAEYLSDTIPFTQAKDLDVDLPHDDHGRVDDFIDDGIVIVPDIGQNKDRAIPALLLAIHTIFRPVDNNEKIKREDCLSLGKLQEEGFMSETPTILGWIINTRSLTIHLPDKKFKGWSNDLATILKSKNISYQDLEKLIGRLNHAATACPLMRYYLNRIRNTLTKWDKNLYTKKVRRYLSSPVIEDLKLWYKCFLPKIQAGLSLNLISYRRPSIVSWSDACPTGMGGYDSFGNAWQFQLSKEDSIACQRQNNSLEFMAAVITAWVAIQSGNVPKEACFLALCDNSSSVCWLHKANVDDTKNLPLHMAARKYAEVLLQADCCLYSQHIAGVSNTVADILSRKFDLPQPDLSTFITSHYPKQVPLSFKISPLPQEICSWLTLWLRKCRERWASQKEQKTRKNVHGTDGSNIQSVSDSTMTFGSDNLPLNNAQPSWEHLQQRSEDASFQDLIQRSWQQAQSKRPLQNWVRFLGQTWGTTPRMSQVLRNYTQLCPDNSKE